MNLGFGLSLLVAQLLTAVTAQSDNLGSALVRFMQRGEADLRLEQKDYELKMLKEYDFIVVGAGTAGCAIAARLSENPEWKVLLLEAGGPETLAMDVPVMAHFLQLSPEINWGYRSQTSNEFCLGLKNQRCNLPRGKVMGGSSVLNYMMYTRGNRRDYDAWAAMGNEGWSFKDVLPYFKKYEGSTIPDAEEDMVGRQGPVKISYPDYRTEIAKAFVGAMQEDGVPQRDYNGRIQRGVSYLQSTTYQAIRWSSNRAYLYPLKGKRNNLHIRKNALVTKLLIDSKTNKTLGIQMRMKGKSYEILARKEVIVCAGAINSPQLLMLSGIGPAKHLKDKGIEVIADLAVGHNLQDHFAPMVTFLTNATALHTQTFFETEHLINYGKNRGIFSLPGGVEAIGFYDLDHPDNVDGWPDMELFLVGGSLKTNPATLPAFGIRQEIYESLYKDILNSTVDAFLIFPMILQPRSKGKIVLQSKDPLKYPLIYMNYLKDPYDLDIAVRGILKAISLVDQPSFQRINATLLSRQLPACRKYGNLQSYEYWACYARYFTMTIYHYAGTCKMGPRADPTSVVDARLRVHGVEGLRVVDASIMPKLVAGHPNGPVFMIAEKAADMIKQDYNFI